MKLAIMGYGFVGRATELLLTINGNTDILIHDPMKNQIVKDWSGVEYAFICVPTPENVVGDLDLSEVFNCYKQCLDLGIKPVIRSTIGPDQVPMFDQAIMMPEFLREAHWESDTKEINDVILGGDIPDSLREVFPKRQVVMVSAVSAMMYKLTRNALLAVKVVLANHVNEVCDSLGADYDQLIRLLNRDNTLGYTHWDVPGPDGKYGFGGKCLPKDLLHMSGLCDDPAYNIFRYATKLNCKLRSKPVDKA